MGTIGEHDRSMRKRLRIIIPIAVLAHLMLFVTFERVNIVKDIIMIGYEGPPKLEPEVSILDDRTPEGAVSTRQDRPMIVQDVVIEGEARPKRSKRNETSPPFSERTREQKISLAEPGDYAFRSYPSRAAVPYRQDYVILRMVKPEYPGDAIARAEEGYVLVEAYIAPDGVVNEAHVRSSFGPRSFEESSLAAVRQFLFKPVLNGERPIPFWVSFLVRFQLRR